MEKHMRAKDESIRVRLTKEQKDELKIKARLNKESVSSYILRKSLGEEMDIYWHIPDRVRICAVMNEVYHGIAKRCGSEMECAVREAFYSALENYGCGERKE